MIPITGFNPGADPTQPGVVTDCVNMIPTVRGMKAAGAGEDVGVSALADPCLGAVMQRKIDGTARVIAGTTDALYEWASGAWQDRSKLGGYTTGNEKWRYCQFGDATIATNYADAIQVSTSTTFSDLSGTPPKAKICTSAAGFVLLFNYNDGVNIFNDGWWCSGLYNHETWTASASTQAANGRLLETFGDITAARPLGSGVVAYKKQSMYLGQYVGPPVIWSWNLIANDVGAYSQEAVINTGDVHYFIGQNGIFMYDGSRPTPIGAIEVRDYLRNDINLQYSGNIVGGYDQKTSLCYWFYPSSSSTGTPDKAIIYNTITGKFGAMTKNVNSVLEYVTPNMDWSSTGIGAVAATWGGWSSSITWKSPIFYGESVGMSFFNADDDIIYKFESPAGSSSITTGDVGDDTKYLRIRRVRPHFTEQPDSASMTHYHKSLSGEPLQTGDTVTINDGKFDILNSDRYHRLKFNFTGDVEMTAYEMTLTEAGKR